MEEPKKRKTGLGVDVFFSPAPEGIAGPPPAVTPEEATPAATTPPSPMETPEATSMRAPEPKLSKPTRKPATRAAKAEQPKARGADGPEMVKLTVMTPHEYLDQLEDLKRQERRRLSGSGEKKYRQKRTVTYLVNQAIADLLAKSGFKVIRYEE